nr:basic proline-rich protein-like [Aegilops tauschii subsp. strangulata]
MRHHGCAATNAVSLRAPPRGQEDRRGDPSDGSSITEAERERTTSTAVVREARASGTVAVAVRTPQRGIPGHPWPGQARNGPAKPRRPRCSRLASTPPAPADHRRSPPPPDGHANATPVAGPPRPRWGLKGPNLGRAGAASPRSPAPPAAPPPPRTRPRRCTGPPPPEDTVRSAPSRAGETLDG